MKHILLFLPCCLLLLPACRRDQSVWETNWQAPLLKDSLTLGQLVEDSILTVNGGYYELAINRTIYELSLDDLVGIPDTTVNHAYAFGLNGFTVQPGVSFVNNDIQEHIIELGDVQLKKVRVKSGGINISVQSPIETKTFFTVELPGVVKNGVTLSRNFTAPAGTNANPGLVTGFVDLAGYEMDLRGVNGNSWNRIQSKMQVSSDPNGPAVVINTDDSVRFVFGMENIRLDYARGYFGSKLITDTLTETIEALTKITDGMIDLPESTIELELENGMKVNAKLMLTLLKNTNNQNTSVSLTHPSIHSWITINGATGNEYSLSTSTTEIQFTGQNSNIEQFLENHGAKNEIGFQLQINPWGNVSGGWDEVFPQSALKVNLAGNMPLNVGLNNLTLQDTFDFSFKQDFTRTHIASGSMWLKATNAFPLSGKVTMYFLDSFGNQLGSVTGSTDVLSSVYGTLVNNIQQKKSDIEFAIPESLVGQLEKVTQLSVKLVLNTPNASSNISEQVAIPADAFFAFKLGAKLKVEARL